MLHFSSCIITIPQPIPLFAPRLVTHPSPKMPEVTLSSDEYDIHPLFKDSEISLDKLAARGLLLPKERAVEAS